MVLTFWATMLGFFRLMVRANSEHATAKRVKSLEGLPQMDSESGASNEQLTDEYSALHYLSSEVDEVQKTVIAHSVEKLLKRHLLTHGRRGTQD